MNPESGAAYNAFLSINKHFPLESSRLSRMQVSATHTAKQRLQQVYNKSDQLVEHQLDTVLIQPGGGFRTVPDLWRTNNDRGQPGPDEEL